MVRSWIAQEIDLAMTFSPSVADRRAANRRRWARPLVTAAVAIGLLAPLPAAAATSDEDAVGFSVAPSNQGVVASGQSLVLSVTTVNPGADALAEGELIVERGARRLTTEGALDAWLTAGDASGSFVEISTTDVDAVAAQSEANATLALDDDDTGIDDLAAGMYPIRATYDTGGESVSTRTVIVKPRSASGAAGVGVIVPITAGAISTGMLGAEALTELTGPDGSLTAQLDAVTATPAILAVDPAIAASIRALGSSAPATAEEWLDRLMALPNERFALQYGDADLAAQVGAGLDAPLQMTSFAPYLDPANFDPPDTAGTDDGDTPAASPTPSTPVLPTPEQLLDVGATRDAVYWPATGTAGAEVAETLSGLGTSAAASESPLIVLPDSVVNGSSPVTARAAAGEADLLVYDSDLSADLLEASTTDAPTERAALLSALTARTTLAAASGPLLLTVDRADGRSSAALRDTILAVAGLPARVSVGLDSLVAEDAVRVTLDPVDADAARAAALAGFIDAGPDLNRVAAVLEDPDLLRANERATELQLLGNAWSTSPDDWAEAIVAHQARITAWSDGVALVPGQDIDLWGSNAVLPFTVRNDLPWPATVDLFVTPNDARLVLTGETTVVVGAEQTARVQVPVEALVGSGRSSIDLQLRTPGGVDLGERQTYSVSVQAEWESAAMIGLSVLVTALVVLGIVRTVRRRRRGGVRSDGRAG